MRIVRFILALTLVPCLLFSHPGKILQNFNTPYTHPTGLTFDGKNIWIADYKAKKIICINPENSKKVKEISSPGTWPMGLAWDGKYLWNADFDQQKIFRIDPENGRIMKVIDTPSGNPDGLAWDGRTLWVTDFKARKIMKIDLSDGTAVKTLTAPARSPNGLAFDGEHLWCSDRLMDEIYMIDPDNGEVILILDAPGPYSKGMAWDGNYLWNVDMQNDKIYRITRFDDELYITSNPRRAKITYTHSFTVSGKGKCRTFHTYIAIPAEMPQQKIISKAFSPKNFRIEKDRWNQPVAVFDYKNIKPGNTVESVMQVDAEVYEIRYFILPEKCGSLSDIPEDIRALYTADGSKYLLDDPYISDLVKKIVGKETNPYWIARRIFDYVRTHLEYKLEGGWNTAPVVLQRGTGSCSEYTFSFIALCRAAGIPARYVGSVVVRGDDACWDNVFHRWPEIYLPNYGWIPIDPQGGDRPLPRDRAARIGRLSNRFLITTQNGGDSGYLGWYYNSYEDYTTDPQVQVDIRNLAEWEPLK